MQTTLTQIITLAALVKEVHWNIQGPGFIAVHRYLDEVSATCDEYIDDVAEHMSAVKQYGLPRWTLDDFETFPQLIVKGRGVQDGLRAVVPMLTELVEHLERQLANDTDDPAGQDLLTRALQDFNRHLWFLSSELG